MEKRRIDDEARARDRWAHRSKMLPDSSNINPSARSRSPDVSQNTSIIPQSDHVDAVISNHPVQDSHAQNARMPTRSATLSSVPDPVGSFAPPLVTVPTAVKTRQHVSTSDRFVSIEELAHFGKLFMKIVPGAIINLEKWTGDIEPISVMEEAWLRVKGIPMKFRSKSTVYYAASFVGKPLALDKNCLRNFAYARVKIGHQDLSLVPNTRIGEIKKGFYEFQYTRELFEPSPPAGARTGAAENIPGNGGDQGTPKR
ncbi:hypothetical protein QYE76_010524 [Lolium multiflorum]|uniref:DUF4283 domain-containing protein n=1 Tax=Lolium multiflorum TaxID=4521 RepID=A0AAD8X4F6_LOLMU|nr:hypothetical protein QYE76_010524 [Lolium multiflorum]